MVAQQFSHVRAWVFDLDNTLYPPSMRLFDQIEVKMTAWVMRRLGLSHAEADRLRSEYWRQYGTTLAGLMAHHGIDPWTYLLDVPGQRPSNGLDHHCDALANADAHRA